MATTTKATATEPTPDAAATATEPTPDAAATATEPTPDVAATAAAAPAPGTLVSLGATVAGEWVTDPERLRSAGLPLHYAIVIAEADDHLELLMLGTAVVYGLPVGPEPG